MNSHLRAQQGSNSGTGQRADAHDGGMGEFRGRVSHQRWRRNLLFDKHALDQEPRPGPLLPVDETQALPGHVAEASNPRGIAPRQNQALLAPDEGDQPIARRTQTAQKWRQLAALYVDGDVETRGVDSPFIEKSQRIEASHEGEIQLEPRR